MVPLAAFLFSGTGLSGEQVGTPAPARSFSGCGSRADGSTRSEKRSILAAALSKSFCFGLGCRGFEFLPTTSGGFLFVCLHIKILLQPGGKTTTLPTPTPTNCVCASSVQGSSKGPHVGFPVPTTLGVTQTSEPRISVSAQVEYARKCMGERGRSAMALALRRVPQVNLDSGEEVILVVYFGGHLW